MKERNITLDVIRSLACLLVIIYHSPKTGVVGSIEASGASYLGVSCIGLFFMVSGYLLLPTKESLLPFLKRRMKRILSPLLIWTLFYISVNFVEYGTPTGQSWIRIFVSIPFSRQGSGVLWFLYTITGLYVLAPILSAWLLKAKKVEVEFLIALFGISLCYPFLRPFIDLTEGVYGILYYFSGFAGYFLLGYYVKFYKPQLPIWGVLTMYFVPVLLAIFSKLAGIEMIYHSYEYLSLPVAFMVYGIFQLIVLIDPERFLSNIWKKMIVNFSNCSFGIYLIHIFVMREGVWDISFLSCHGGLIQIISTVILTTIISWLIVYLLSHIPYSEYIVGYRNKRK